MFGVARLNTLSAAMADASGPTITATGGTISYYTSGGIGYKVHSFGTAGATSFIVSATTGTPTVNALILGGGGGGGGSGVSGGKGGGGGAGQYQYITNLSVSAQTYSLTIGAAGTGSVASEGTAGGSTVGLGYTSVGGGFGGLTTGGNGASGGGGGCQYTGRGNGGSATNGNIGGNGFTTAQTRGGGGGGGGSGGAGANGTNEVGGNAGAGTSNSITGTAVTYTVGGPGGGFTSGTGEATTKGSGGAGYTGGTTNGSGSPGQTGTVIISYPANVVTSYSFVSATTSATSTIAWPTIQAGDLAVLVDGAGTTTTATTAVTPTGFTNIANTFINATISNRTMASYKVLVGTETGNITGMNGSTNRKHLLIYRPNIPINQVTISSVNEETTTVSPTNQTLSMAALTGPYIGIAVYMSNGTVSSRGTTVTATREVNNGSATNYTKTFESTSSAVTFANSTISMGDYGTNGMVSFTIRLI